jgi:hypothetical protein
MRIAERIAGVSKMSTAETSLSAAETRDAERELEIAHIRESLRGLRFGTVNIVVQDGVIVQIDRTEKRRIRRGDSK